MQRKNEQRRQRTIGLAFMAVGIFLFTMQDMIIKDISGLYPVHEIVFVRSFIALPIIMAIAWFEHGFAGLRTRRAGAHVLRGTIMFAAYTTYYLALGQEAGRIKGMVLIAPAHDMTDALMWRKFSPQARAAILQDGVWHRPSAYGEPYPITRTLIEDGRRHLLLDKTLAVGCPVRILQGSADADVPWQHAMRIFDSLEGSDIRMILVKNGDHRLSRLCDLELLTRTVEELANLADSTEIR